LISVPKQHHSDDFGAPAMVWSPVQQVKGMSRAESPFSTEEQQNEKTCAVVAEVGQQDESSQQDLELK